MTRIRGKPAYSITRLYSSSLNKHFIAIKKKLWGVYKIKYHHNHTTLFQHRRHHLASLFLQSVQAWMGRLCLQYQRKPFQILCSPLNQ